MSDPQNPYGPNDGGQQPTNPYGQPPAPSPSDGQPPEYTAPQHGGPQPAGQQYGQPPSGQTSYGQSPYGQPPTSQQYGGPPAYGTTDPNKRPGTVTAASVITLIFSGLGFVLFTFGLIAVLVARDDMVREINNEIQNQQGMEGLTGDGIAVFLVVAFVVLIAWTLATMIFAVWAMKGKNWARVLVVISSVVTALFSLLAILSGVSAITLIASVAVVVLYFTGGANQWFKRSSGPTA